MHPCHLRNSLSRNEKTQPESGGRGFDRGRGFPIRDGGARNSARRKSNRSNQADLLREVRLEVNVLIERNFY